MQTKVFSKNESNFWLQSFVKSQILLIKFRISTINNRQAKLFRYLKIKKYIKYIIN